jgi:AraC-like DNA-binding protein
MSYVQLVLRRFGTVSSKRAELLEGLDLTADDLDDPKLQMSFAQQERLFDNLSESFGDGWILDAPEVWAPASQGALGMAILSAATLGEAVFVMAAYATVQSNNHRLTIVRDVDWVTLRHGFASELPGQDSWVAIAGVFLALSTMFQFLLGGARSAIRYEFTRSPPDYAARLETLVSGEIRWRASANAALVPQRLMEVRSPLADPMTHEAALRVLEQAKRSERAPDGVKGRVEHLLANSPSGRLPSARAARTLGLSQRTLVRRLADSGVTYRDLIDSELKSRAQRWLESGSLSHAEIGERLGFADATGFSRACRRWFRHHA